MGAAETITAWGLPRAADIVALAQEERLDLAIACTMLDKESEGRNVWGADGVSTGGYYRKGAPVTREDYLAWKPHRGRLGSQGVGPAQLTYPPLQDQADAIGGCWDWRANTRIGFRHLAQLVRAYGVQRGFVAYNGGDRAARNPGLIPAAETYGVHAMDVLGKWRLRLGSSTPRPAPTSAPPRAPEEDDDMTPEQAERQVRIEQKLDLLLSQMVVGEGRLDDPRTWGWTTWGGGTDERLTPVDLLRRGNVETRVANLAINRVAAETAAAVGGLSKQTGELVAEVRALRAGGVPLDTAPVASFDALEFTGTARLTTT